MYLHYFICHIVDSSSVMLCFMILRFCSIVVFIVIMHHVMLAVQWFNQHSKYAPFSDGLSIKKYNDGGELEYIYRILINTW